VGDHKDPWETSTAGDYIKPLASKIEDSSDDEEPCDSEMKRLTDIQDEYQCRTAEYSMREKTGNYFLFYVCMIEAIRELATSCMC